MKVSPSEIIYWEILPSLRKEMVFMMRDLGLKQSEIAKILEVTPSAISQYLTNKRGDFEFTDTFKKDIKKSVREIIENNASAFIETNKLIKKFETSKEICHVCHTKNETDNSCNVCHN